MSADKPIFWEGSAYRDLLGFCAKVRRMAGFQLGKLRAGQEPDDWKPLEEIGQGVEEIRLRDASGIYRLIYIARFDEAIYVLHCFQKKTQKTRQRDKMIAQARYRAIAARS